MDDHHKRHELKRDKVIYLVHRGDTVPAGLEADIPGPQPWEQPVPRRSRDSYCTPFITYNRTHHLTRHLCARVPILKPIARLIF